MYYLHIFMNNNTGIWILFVNYYILKIIIAKSKLSENSLFERNQCRIVLKNFPSNTIIILCPWRTAYIWLCSCYIFSNLQVARVFPVYCLWWLWNFPLHICTAQNFIEDRLLRFQQTILSIKEIDLAKLT